MSLWGNKCDLSISAGQQHRLEKDAVLKQTELLKGHILANDLEKVSDLLLSQKGQKNAEIHFVLDNAGMELFSDLCLAEYLLEGKFADKIVFHAKVSGGGE